MTNDDNKEFSDYWTLKNEFIHLIDLYKKLKSTGIFSSIEFYLAFLIIINILLFSIYWTYSPVKDINVIINYLQSPVFSVVTVSLLLPILSLFISNTFKIKENAELQIEKRKDAKMQEQLASINATQSMWAHLTKIIGEIRYYNKKETPIEKILLEIHQFVSDMEDVSITWDYQFPKLPIKSHKHFLTPINTLNNSALAAAQFIYEHPDEEKEILEYQSALGVIAINIEFNCHDVIMNILKNYMEIEYNDDNEDVHKMELNKNFKLLEDYSQELKKFEFEHQDDLFFLDDGKVPLTKIQEIRKIYDELKKWCENNQEKKIKECPVFEDFETSYKEILNDDNLNYYSIQIPSKNYIIALAKHLDFDMFHKGWEHNLSIINED